MKTLTVIARKGVAVPMLTVHAMITDAAPKEVPDLPYYRRRMADGDLLLWESPAPVAKSKKAAAKE
nr:MAG TPA: Protein of unknown function (DUF2635) [Caudoviricetes sp.]